MLRLEDAWIWDSWIADDGERYHLFFLKAPRALEDAGLRHTAATIGHASSLDLVDWTVHEDALLPDAKRWDDLALLDRLRRPGSRTARGGCTTPRSPATRATASRTSASASRSHDDLTTWQRVGDRPLVEPDPRWYRTIDGTHSETWRDPFVFADPDGDGWHMLITARHPDAPRLSDGVLAHARSADLTAWELQPPLTEPAGFGQIEVPQIRSSTAATCSSSPATRRSRARSRSSASAPTAPGTCSATTRWAVAHRRGRRSRPRRSCSPRRSSSSATAHGRSSASSTRSRRASSRSRSSTRSGRAPRRRASGLIAAL
jgi:hypothetical protein